MKIQVKEQIKILLAQEGLNFKELTELLSSKTTKNYEQSNFSHRLGRGTLTYNEVLNIADILGYDVKFEKRKS